MGGSKTTVEQAPTTPAPSASDSAADLYKAQLKYNPKLYEQQYQSYNQYAPKFAASDLAIQQQYAPEYQKLQQQMYPQQTQLVEALSGQALQRMGNKFGYSAEEQAALDASRQRAREQAQENLRSQANLGGSLFGGRSQLAENRAMNELEQAFALEDINRQLQASQQALSYATPVLQIQYPQVSGYKESTPNYWQSVTPDANTLYNAMYQASQPQNYFNQQKSPWSFGWSPQGGLSVGYGQ